MENLMVVLVKALSYNSLNINSYYYFSIFMKVPNIFTRLYLFTEAPPKKPINF